MAFGDQSSGFRNQLIPLFEAGNRVIIDSHGLLIYNGVPAADTLLLSSSLNQFFDSFGNNVLGGLTVYGQGGVLGRCCQFYDGGIIVNSNAAGAHQSGAWNQVGEFELINFNGLSFWSTVNTPVVVGDTAQSIFSILESAADIAARGSYLLYGTNPPALGSLNMTIAGFNATAADHFGNAIPAHGFNFGTWDNTGTLRQHFGIDTSGRIYFVDPGGNQWIIAPSNVVPVSLTITGPQGGPVLYIVSNAANQGFITPVDPNSAGIQESWHQPVTTGFAAVAGVQPVKYKLAPDGMVDVTGFMQASAAYANGATIWTMPAGYRPGATATIPVTIFLSGSFFPAWAQVTAAGVVSISTAIGANSTVTFSGRYRLTG